MTPSLEKEILEAKKFCKEVNGRWNSMEIAYEVLDRRSIKKGKPADYSDVGKLAEDIQKYFIDEYTDKLE